MVVSVKRMDVTDRGDKQERRNENLMTRTTNTHVLGKHWWCPRSMAASAATTTTTPYYHRRRRVVSSMHSMELSIIVALVAIAVFAPLTRSVHGWIPSSASRSMTTYISTKVSNSMDQMSITFRSSPYDHRARTAVKAASSMNDGFVDDGKERGEIGGGGGSGGRGRTLYDVLGASPKDSAAQLRERYKNLAREFHPDAVTRREKQMDKLFYLKKNSDPESESTDDTIGRNVNQYDIAEINAAYQVLSNPKERLRYDRQLQANEFKAGFESIVQRGFDNAIPFIKRTADTTQSVVEQSVESSSRVFQEIARSAPNVVSNVVGGTVLSSFNSNTNQYDIAEINAAYQVLSNPKERLRYDRQLQANEFKAGFESMVQRGFDNAIPFIKKTANTTQSVVEQSVESSSRVFQEIAKSAPNVVSNVVGGTVLSTFSNNNNNNQRNNIQQDPATLLERRAEMELSKAANLKEQIANLPNTRHQLLQKDTTATTITYNTNDDGRRTSSSRKQLSSTDALNIMKTLSRAPDGRVATSGVDALPSLVKDITTLGETERVFETTTKQYQTLEREVTMADRKVQQTTRAKEVAQQNLLDAQKALAEAQSNMDLATKQHASVTQQIKKTHVELDKSRRSMETMREKVRVGLYSHETKSIELRSKLLRKESMDLEISAKKLMSEANRERSKQKKLDRQQKGKTG